jgi:hypothetical protein
MKMVLVTERGRPVALVPGSMEEQERPHKPPRKEEGKIEKPMHGLVAGPNQQMREVEVPDDVAQETNPAEFVKKLKKAIPDIAL